MEARDNLPEVKQAFNTLLFSWGGDTPPESVWAANEFMKIFCPSSEIMLEEDLENVEAFLNQLNQ